MALLGKTGLGAQKRDGLRLLMIVYIVLVDR